MNDRTIEQTVTITLLKVIAHYDVRTTCMVNFAYGRRVSPTGIAGVSRHEGVNGVVGTEGNMESSGKTVPRKAHQLELEHLERKAEEAGESPEIICNPGLVCESRPVKTVICNAHDGGISLVLWDPR